METYRQIDIIEVSMAHVSTQPCKIWHLQFIGTRLNPIDIPYSHSRDGGGCEGQPTPKEPWAGLTGECMWWTRLGETVPPDNTSQTLLMLTVGLILLVWSYANKADLQQQFPRSRGRCWPASGLFSTHPWSAVLGLQLASYRWEVLQTGWYVGVECDEFWTRIFSFLANYKKRRNINENDCWFLKRWINYFYSILKALI